MTSEKWLNRTEVVQSSTPVQATEKMLHVYEVQSCLALIINSGRMRSQLPNIKDQNLKQNKLELNCLHPFSKSIIILRNP